MAQEIREFAVTVPGSTPKAAPLVTQLTMPQREVVRISWRVPPGPSGLMGWQLTSAGAPVIPIQLNTYMVTDNQADTWDLEGYLDSGNWQCTAYNTGIYPHTFYLTFLLDLPGTVVASPPPPSVAGIGVIGTSGSADVSNALGAADGSSSTPPNDDPSAVIAVVLAALAAQLA
jgi:hypothetical protein